MTCLVMLLFGVFSVGAILYAMLTPQPTTGAAVCLWLSALALAVLYGLARRRDDRRQTRYDRWHHDTLLKVRGIESRAANDLYYKRIDWDTYVRVIRKAAQLARGLHDYRPLYDDLKADGTIEDDK